MSNKSIIQRLNDLESKPTLTVYQGWSPYYVSGTVDGIGRTPPHNILKDGNPISQPIELKVGDIITSIYGVSIYRTNGAVGAISVNFQIQNYDTENYVDIGNYAYQYIDPTQNQEMIQNSNTFVVTNDVRFQNVSLRLNSLNSRIDSGARPYMTMFIQKFNH